MATIDVQVTGGGSILDGSLRNDTTVVATCSLCEAKVEAAARLTQDAYACGNCLRARLDALSVARFRLGDTRASVLPWGKVTG